MSQQGRAEEIPNLVLFRTTGKQTVWKDTLFAVRPVRSTIRFGRPLPPVADEPKEEAKKIVVGMVVEADEGDLGQEDISDAKVSDIVHDQAGRAERGEEG